MNELWQDRLDAEVADLEMKIVKLRTFLQEHSSEPDPIERARRRCAGN